METATHLTRPTIPARSSLQEAEHWLLCESLGGYASQANEIRAARISREGRIGKGAMDWLRGVSVGNTMKASWARIILREIAHAGMAVSA